VTSRLAEDFLACFAGLPDAVKEQARKSCFIGGQMSYQAMVFNVMIASPGDVQTERNIVRDVVNEWNHVNSATQKIVLLPVGWETHSTPSMGDRPQSIINWQVLKDSDLLIAIFRTRLGTPTGKAASGTVEEIEEHVKAGKPAMLYFYATPVAPDNYDHDQYQALNKFKEECKQRGLYGTYNSNPEFYKKIRRHIGKTLNSHPYFEEFRHIADGATTQAPPPSDLGVTHLSREAQEFLLEAVAGDGRVLVYASLDGSAVQTNGKNFVEAGNPRSRATWERAVQELFHLELLQMDGHNEGFYRVSSQGYNVADLLKP